MGLAGGEVLPGLLGGLGVLGVLVEAGLPSYAWQVWEPLLTGAERVAAL